MSFDLVQDVSLMLCYGSIAVALGIFAVWRRRAALPFVATASVFSVFFVILGLDHVFKILDQLVWHVDTRLTLSIFRWIILAESIPAAVVIWPLLLGALALPLQVDLEAEISAKTSSLLDENAKLRDRERTLLTLNREVNHRAKNLLAIVQSIAKQTARSMRLPNEFMVKFSGRLTALATAHDLIARSDWHALKIVDVINSQLAHLTDVTSRIDVRGPNYTLPPDVAQYLALAIHELGTNAVKHGSLSTKMGTVNVRWDRRGDELWINWHEAGGSDYAPDPSSTGFGTALLTKIVPSYLRGSCKIETEYGFSWSLAFPVNGDVHVD